MEEQEGGGLHVSETVFGVTGFVFVWDSALVVQMGNSITSVTAIPYCVRNSAYGIYLFWSAWGLIYKTVRGIVTKSVRRLRPKAKFCVSQKIF